MPAQYERLGPEVVFNAGGKTAITIFIFMLIGFVVESELVQVSSYSGLKLAVFVELISGP